MKQPTPMLDLGPAFNRHVGVAVLQGNITDIMVSCLSQKKDCYCVMIDYQHAGHSRRICSENVHTEAEANHIRDSLIMLLYVHEIAIPVNKTPLTSEMLTIGCFGGGFTMTIQASGPSQTFTIGIE